MKTATEQVADNNEDELAWQRVALVRCTRTRLRCEALAKQGHPHLHSAQLG